MNKREYHPIPII